MGGVGRELILRVPAVLLCLPFYNTLVSLKHAELSEQKYLLFSNVLLTDITGQVVKATDWVLATSLISCWCLAAKAL